MPGQSRDRPPNLWFFGDLGLLAPKEGYARIAERYRAADRRDQCSPACCADLGRQIVVNSRVASGKYRMFRQGVEARLIGLGVYASNALLLASAPWIRSRVG